VYRLLLGFVFLALLQVADPTSILTLAMSKAFKAFKDHLFQSKNYTKLFAKQTPGKRIAPAQANNNDAELQLRLDAGEVKNGIKNVYLQVNSEAKNEALKKFRTKGGTYANLATATVDENTPSEKQEEVAKAFWDKIESQAKKNIG
jgi:hypothetical protein